MIHPVIIILSSTVLVIAALAAISALLNWRSDKAQALNVRFSHMENKIKDYNERYCLPKDEFLWKWHRDPGQSDDMEIVEWCREREVRFKYQLDQTSSHVYPKNTFEVWITDPRVAMEFKLRFYNVT